MTDLLIRGATVIDGSGGPAIRADLAIQGGRIARVAPDGAEREARRVVDAGGLTVAPGFIDMHSHADFTLPSYPDAVNSLAQGVTTEVIGNCGYSPAPLARDSQLADAQRAYDLSAGRGGAAVFYATTLQRAGRPREAVDLYEEWLAQVGTDQEPLRALLANNIAMILATDNMDLDRALERVQSALKHSQQRKHAPETLAYLDTRAMVYYRQGKFTEALADMNEVLRSPEQYKKTIEVEVANSSVDDRHRAYQLHREMHGLAQMLYHRALVHQALAAAAKNDADLRKTHLLAAALDRRRILELGYTPDASLF